MTFIKQGKIVKSISVPPSPKDGFYTHAHLVMVRVNGAYQVLFNHGYTTDYSPYHLSFATATVYFDNMLEGLKLLG